MLKAFYGPFHETVEKTLENADRPTRERVLGKDPESGRTLLTRMTRNGPVAQIGAPDELDEDGQSMETITYEEALKLFELPRDLGEYKGEPVQVGVGRFGPYVRMGEKFFVSIPKDEDPLELSQERAFELIKAKQKEDAPVGTYKGKPITKGKGRFGPFLKYDGLFVNVPRKYDFDNISLEDMHELIEKKIEKEANRYIHRWDDEKISVENGRWGPLSASSAKTSKSLKWMVSA